MRRILFFTIACISLYMNGFSQKTRLQKIDSIRQILLKETIDTNKAGHLVKIARLFFNEGNYTEAMLNLQSAKKLATSKTKKTELAKAYHVGSSYYSSKSDYTLAQKLEDTCLLMRRALNDEKGIVNSTNTIGILRWYVGDYPGALKYYMSALSLSEKMKDTTLMLNTYNNIGIVYYNLKKYDLSVDYYKLVLNTLDSAKQAFLQASTLDNIALVYYEQGRYTEALQYHLRGMKIREMQQDEMTLSISYLNIANAYSALNQEDMAVVFYNKSIALKEKLKDENGLAHCYNDISAIYMKQKKYGAAKNNLLKAYTLAKRVNSLDLLKSVSGGLAECFEMLADYQSAYMYHKLHMTYKDSIFNSENNKVMMEMESKYQNEKKEIENKLLKNENRLQSLESEKKDSDLKKQRIIIILVSFGLLIIATLAVLVYKSFKQTQKAKMLIEKQKHEVESQKQIIEEHQKEILDSIHYAKRIQYTLLAHQDFVNEHLKQNFILFKPKDIVSGDFYWATLKDDKFYLAVCDSTGHGVPGAFMSLLNIGFLSEAINEKNILEPNKIFDYVRERLINSISKEGQKDGFDGILLCMDKTTGRISYAAANNTPVLISAGELIEMDKDRMPVGKGERGEAFKLFEIENNKGNMLYLYTDGYADQFGGDKGKKFKYRPLNDMLAKNAEWPLDKQKDILLKTFEAWKGSLEQVDDVLIIGIKL